MMTDGQAVLHDL